MIFFKKMPEQMSRTILSLVYSCVIVGGLFLGYVASRPSLFACVDCRASCQGLDGNPGGKEKSHTCYGKQDSCRCDATTKQPVFGYCRNDTCSSCKTQPSSVVGTCYGSTDNCDSALTVFYLCQNVEGC
jgi:hypothetical protein